MAKKLLSEDFKNNKLYFMNLQGRDYITFEGLMALAHDEGIQGTKTEILKFPDKPGDMTIIRAIVTDKNGKEWSGIGDADANNTNKNVAKHAVRMAETRAVGRALRMMLGTGTMYEEMELFQVQKIDGYQLNKLAKLMKDLDLERPYLQELCDKRYSKNSAGDLTYDDAADLIEFLQKLNIAGDGAEDLLTAEANA